MTAFLAQILASISPTTSPSTLPTTLPAGSALGEALRISGVALVAIFVVMGLFGLLIKLLGKFMPESTQTTD